MADSTRFVAGEDDLTSAQVKRLLRLASDGSAARPDRPPMVAAALAPLDAAGRAMLERALAPSCSLDELRRMKAAAKELVRTSADAPRRDAARLLYHLVVAVALGRGVDISSMAVERRRQLYTRLAVRCAGHPAAGVFARAAGVSGAGPAFDCGKTGADDV